MAILVASTAFVGLSLTAGAAAPSGYTVGNRIAKISGYDQTGMLRRLNDYFDGGNSYVLLSVAALWCEPSREEATVLPDVTAWARAHGIAIHTVTLLAEGGESVPWLPSTQSDASIWAHLFNSSPVLHDNGSSTSQVAIAGHALLDGGFPTTLVLSPDGRIIDQVGGFQTADQLEARLATAVSRGGDSQN
jgi:hypothetical protein